jgi:hypothetical protein
VGRIIVIMASANKHQTVHESGSTTHVLGGALTDIDVAKRHERGRGGGHSLMSWDILCIARRCFNCPGVGAPLTVGQGLGRYSYVLPPSPPGDDRFQSPCKPVTALSDQQTVAG